MTNEMKCSLTHDLLPAYIEGLTGEGSNTFIAAHLVECEKCRAAYRVMAEQRKGAKNDYGAMLYRLIRRRRRRRIVAAAIIGLIVLALLAACLAPWPTRVCGSFEALEWRLGDPDVQTRRTVTIDGVYLNYLFKADSFAGTFEIEGYPETRLEKTCWYADDETKFQMAYFDPQDGMLRIFGTLLLNPYGPKFSVLIMEDDGEWRGWTGSDGLVVSWPAEDRAQALEGFKALAQRCSPHWLGEGKLAE